MKALCILASSLVCDKGKLWTEESKTKMMSPAVHPIVLSIVRSIAR